MHNEKGNNSINQSKEILYPQGIHVSIWELPDDDVGKCLAMVLRNPMANEHDSDNIDSIDIIPEDDRVAFVGTCGHGFYHLAKQVGTCIREEDEGIERAWMKILGWNNPYQKDGAKMEDEDNE